MNMSKTGLCKEAFALRTRYLVMLIVAAATSGHLWAAPADPFVRPIQIALYNPIQIVHRDTSIHGLRLNLLYGENYDVVGFDFGVKNNVSHNFSGLQLGLFSYVRGDSLGIQLGISSYVDGNVTGIQAGIVQVSESSVTGAHVGIYNEIRSRLDGLQLGVVNYTYEVKGIQWGILNASFRMEGLQISTLNWTQELSGTQLGWFNIATRSTDASSIPNAAFQVGIIQFSNSSLIGAQIGGINIVRGQVRGFQWSSVNYADEVKHLQLGALNAASIVEGLQLGLVNWTQELRGVQVGLINIVTQREIWMVIPLVNWTW